MKAQNIPYLKQIFVCTNDRKGEKPSCGDQKGEEIFTELRRIAKERGLHPKIRVAQAKCLGQCSTGCNIMVYSRRSDTTSEVGTPTSTVSKETSEPENIWYSGVHKEDIPAIVEKHFPSEA